MFTYKKYIKQLIEEEIKIALYEQNLPSDDSTPELDPTSGTEQPVDDITDISDVNNIDGTSPEENLDGTDLSGNATGGDDLGGIAGDLGTEDTEGVEAVDDIGGDNGGFGGFGGGGFSFGGGESGLSPDDEEESKTATTPGPEDVEMPDDPIMSITDEALNMLKTTRQPNIILKTVKSSIQRYFSEIEDATPVIKALWDTEDVVLRDVARRLLLFIRGI